MLPLSARCRRVSITPRVWRAWASLPRRVVHNFKNVLMGVSGMLDVALMLMERGGSMDAVRERLVDAQGHVFRGNQVLQRLLDFARGIPQEVADVHLDVLLPDVVALCKAHPASRGIRIRAELPGQPAPCACRCQSAARSAE